jgi:hypothetical protein
LVGGVVDPLAAPIALVLGRYDQRGRLRVIGRTHPLPLAARADLARLVRPATGVHPWPTPLAGSRFGLPGTFDPVHTAPVAPTVVVELEVDNAHEHGRFRHGARYIRTAPNYVPTTCRPGPGIPSRRDAGGDGRGRAYGHR